MGNSIKPHYPPLFQELLEFEMAYNKTPESKKNQEIKGKYEVIKSSTLGLSHHNLITIISDTEYMQNLQTELRFIQLLQKEESAGRF